MVYSKIWIPIFAICTYILIVYLKYFLYSYLIYYGNYNVTIDYNFKYVSYNPRKMAIYRVIGVSPHENNNGDVNYVILVHL